jgi:hypothetical protein
MNMDTKEIVALVLGSAVISALVSAAVSATVTISVQSCERDARKKELLLKVSVEPVEGVHRTYCEPFADVRSIARFTHDTADAQNGAGVVRAWLCVGRE